MDIALLLILIINIFTFAVYAWDKYAAIRGMYRVSEKNLLSLAFFFGAAGALLSMKIFHHKTQKPVFVLLVPIVFVFQLVIVLVYMYKVGYGY